MKWIIFCNIVIATVFTKVVCAHEDLEGFCSVVLKEYPTSWGVDVTAFIECVCEESHTGNGETLVVCQYAKNVGSEIGSKPTGSCDAKFCLFTQECRVPPITDFQTLELDPKNLDLSIFDQWCVDKEDYATTIEIDVPNPTNAPAGSSTEVIEVVSTSSPISTPLPQKENVLLIKNDNIPGANMRSYILSFQWIVGTSIAIGVFC